MLPRFILSDQPSKSSWKEFFGITISFSLMMMMDDVTCGRDDWWAPISFLLVRLIHTPVGRKHSFSSMQRQELSNGIWYIEIEAGATPPAWHSTALEGASQGVAQNVITKTQNEIITFNRFFPSHSFKWHYYDIVHVQGQIHFIVSSSKNTRTRVDKSDSYEEEKEWDA